MSQIAEFYAAVLQSLPELSPAEMQEWIGPSRSTLRSGLSFLSLGLIYIDHSVRPAYPDWVKQGYVDTPDFIRLEQSGPSDYSLTSLQLSLHPKQEQGVASGHEIYEYQKKLGLEDCLGLADLLAIQKLGIAAFRRHWKGKAVFGWKSVVQYGFGDLNVPYLIENDDQMILNWNWLDNDWNANNPALRFAILFILSSRGEFSFGVVLASLCTWGCLGGGIGGRLLKTYY